MRRVTLFLCVIAFAVLAASSASAYNYYMFIGSAYPGNFVNPYATTEGEWWINQGGTISLLDQDINVQLLVDAPGVGWTTMAGSPANGIPLSAGTATTSTLLLSSGYDSYTGGSTAYGDMTFFTPGCLYDINGTGYVAPGSGPYEFQFLAWTGLYPTYAAAEASHTPGVYAAASGLFSETPSYATDPILAYENNQPAVILQQVPVPEPSALLLAACGIAGLLTYAWRRRK